MSAALEMGGVTPMRGRTDPVARARAITPIIAAAAPEIESGKGLTPAVLDAMHGAAIFRTLIPRAYNGEEVKPSTFFRLLETVAAGAHGADADGRAPGQRSPPAPPPAIAAAASASGGPPPPSGFRSPLLRAATRRHACSSGNLFGVGDGCGGNGGGCGGGGSSFEGEEQQKGPRTRSVSVVAVDFDDDGGGAGAAAKAAPVAVSAADFSDEEKMQEAAATAEVEAFVRLAAGAKE